MEMIGIGNSLIRNRLPEFGQPCQVWNILKPEGYGIEVKPISG